MSQNITRSEIELRLKAAEKEMAARRQAVIKAATEGNPEYIANMNNQLAEVTGAYTALLEVHKVLAYNESHAPVVASWAESLTRRLVAGADDKWSGRTNDVKRAWFDGFREQAAWLLDA